MDYNQALDYLSTVDFEGEDLKNAQDMQEALANGAGDNPEFQQMVIEFASQIQARGQEGDEETPLALRPPEDFTPKYTETEQALRSAFPRLSTRGGDNLLSDIGLGIGDAFSLGGRSFAGLASGLGTGVGALLGGQDAGQALFEAGKSIESQMQSTGATDPNAKWYDPTAFAETIIKDPTLPLIPLTGGLSAGATAGISNPFVRGTLGGIMEGTLSGGAGALMEQRGLKEELTNTGASALGGGVLGGGAGFLSRNIAPPSQEVEMLKARFDEVSSDPMASPEAVGNALDELTKARELVSKGEDVELPWYIPRDESGRITPDAESDVPFAVYQERANQVKNGLTSEDPFFIATDRVLAPAIQKLKEQRKAFGDKIGAIETEMGGSSTSATPVKAIIASELDKAGRRAVVKDVLDDDGNVVDQVVEIEWKPNIQRKGKQTTKSLSPEMLQIVEEVSLLDDDVNFETLRSLVKDLNQVVKRSATPDPLAQSMLKSLDAQLKQQVRGLIDAQRPELLPEWDDALKGYAERANTIGTIEQKTGKDLANAEGWLKSMVTTGARSSDEMARKIKEYTGADIRKASAFARYANETAGIKERGASLLSETSKMAEETAKQAKKIPVVGAVQDVASSIKTAVTPKPKASKATVEVMGTQRKRQLTGKERDDFFNDYFKRIGTLNQASQALIGQ